MLQNIREIGIFMIVAQAIVHFAPGRQYEKYIKSISSVIILALFLKPFVQMAGGQWRAPSAVLERLEASARQTDFAAAADAAAGSGVESVVIGRMEEELAERLDRELGTDSGHVMRVELTLQDGSGEEDFFLVKVVMGEQPADSGKIAVEEIAVGAPQKEEETSEAYRLRIAECLGLEEERVEVWWDGRD